jgi:hypothetical protein
MESYPPHPDKALVVFYMLLLKESAGNATMINTYNYKNRNIKISNAWSVMELLKDRYLAVLNQYVKIHLL